MLESSIKSQLAEYLLLMQNEVLITASLGTDENSMEMLSFLDEITSMSPKIKLQMDRLKRTPSFCIDSVNYDVGIVFAGIPLGHEFSSFVLALLQTSGRPPKEDLILIDQIKNLTGNYHFETYISLSCHNCPDVVQSLNLMSILNSGITHTMIDGAVFGQEIKDKNIMSVPTVYLNGEIFASGRMVLEDILAKIGITIDATTIDETIPYDVFVVGGGPAGAAAAIYAARKGIRTGILADNFGGQVRDTLGIENFISTKYMEGSVLASNLESHVRSYDVDIIKSQQAKKLMKKDFIEITLHNERIIRSKTVILATGAQWRKVGVPGEDEYKSKGVAYCPHCDGPLFKGKNIAVIGGGNSGIEAAIDLAGIVNHVTVLEFMPELKADRVLQKRLFSLSNVTVLTNVETKKITGQEKVDGIIYMDRTSKMQTHLPLEGVFVQIGLIANTNWLRDTLECNQIGEIVVDSHNSTNLPGVFAAGDCTNSPYKQIIIAMGSGASAALGAFEYLMRDI